MLISGAVFTHHLPEEALPWITEARTIFDEIVIFIEEKRFTPGTVARAEKVGTHVVRYKADKWYDADARFLVAGCKGDWLFMLDYDEQLSPEWQQGRWRQILETTQFTHFWFPRRWLVPSGQYIVAAPWWPDFQLRLLKNNLEGTTFPANLHDTIYIPGPGACFRNLAIHHHVLSLLSRSQRVEKVRHYEQLRPDGGLEHYYLYEDYAPTQAALPAPVTLNVDREVVRMEKLLAERVLDISIDVSAVPRKVEVSAIFWPHARVTNSTDEALYPVGPHPVRLSYHWIDKATRQMVVFDGIRSGLFPGLEGNTTGQFAMAILAPDEPGEYILQTTMVQDGVCWFEDIRPDIVQEFAVSVTAGTHRDAVSSSQGID